MTQATFVREFAVGQMGPKEALKKWNGMVADESVRRDHNGPKNGLRIYVKKDDQVQSDVVSVTSIATRMISSDGSGVWVS